MVRFMTAERSDLAPMDEKTLMHVFKIPLLEAKFLHAMLDQEWVGEEELPAIKYSIRQLIYRLRTKLETMDKRIWVINDSNGRYGVTPTGKEVIKDIVRKALSE